jgi:hypothetical protein
MPRQEKKNRTKETQQNGEQQCAKEELCNQQNH